MPAGNPGRIVDVLLGYWQSDALKAAIEVGMFTAIGGRAVTAARIAAACRAEEVATRRLCDYLVSLGLLRKRQGRYRCAPDAARFLDPRSPDWMAGITEFFNAPPMTTASARLAETVRRGRTAGRRNPSPLTWKRFATATLPLRRFHARTIGDELQRHGVVRGRILEVGAGASPLGIELVRRTRGSLLVVQDQARVVDVALTQARAAGVADRVTAVRGDARRVPLGGPFDLVLMVNFLDYFDSRSRTALLRKAHTALRPGGVLAVCAPLLTESRTGPPDGVAYDLLLLALSADGQPSTFRELTRLLRRAGFQSISRRLEPPIVLARKP
jgi:SAM-dependent methyltransferase